MQFSNKQKISGCFHYLTDMNVDMSIAINELIRDIFSSMVYDCLPIIWQFFFSTSEEIKWFGNEELAKLILEATSSLKQIHRRLFDREQKI